MRMTASRAPPVKLAFCQLFGFHTERYDGILQGSYSETGTIGLEIIS